MMLGVGGRTERSPELAGLLDAISSFCDGPGPCDRSGDELANALIELRGGIDRLEVAFSRTAAQFAESDHHEREGATSPHAWLKSECHMGGYAAAQRFCVGGQLERLPQGTAALEAGQIGFSHLALLAATAEALTESETSRGFSEDRLLPKAIGASVLRFRNACAHYRHAQDPEAYALEEQCGTEARFLELSAREDGCLWLKGFLDNEGGARLRSALEPLARPEGAGDERLRQRRLADALVELAGQALNSGQLPRQAGQRPHLQITASLETLLQLPGAPAAELELGAPLSGQALERISCDCNLTRVILDGKSTILDLGRTKRVVSPALRRALNARDQGCRWPGCERPGTYCDSHHLLHWIRGGKTDLDNLVLICFRHHQLLHEGGWEAHLAHEGRLVVIPPSAYSFSYPRGPDGILA